MMMMMMNLWARYVCTFMTTSGIVTVLGSLQFKITKDDEINNQIELIDGGEKLHIEIKICWCVWRIIVKLDKYWACWWLLILILNWCWYFARRVLVALINVLTHSAIGGEPGKMFREIWRKNLSPVTQWARTLEAAWCVHTTPDTPKVLKLWNFSVFWNWYISAISGTFPNTPTDQKWQIETILFSPRKSFSRKRI